MAKPRTKTRRRKVSTRRRRGVLLPFAGRENDVLGREFLASPEKFLRERNMTFRDLSCPPDVHAAMARGNAFEGAVREAEIAPDPRSIARLKTLAAKHFGRDFEVSLVPYGLKFRERILLRPDLSLTATGSGSVTWLETDADVDD
jgi:hypothetical protein